MDVTSKGSFIHLKDHNIKETPSLLNLDKIWYWYGEGGVLVFESWVHLLGSEEYVDQTI